MARSLLNTHNQIPKHTRPLHYKFCAGGCVHHHTTVLMAKSQGALRQAYKRFWTQHPHVQPDTI